MVQMLTRFFEDTKKLVEVRGYFSNRFLESEEEFKKTHSKESEKKVMLYRMVVKKLIEVEAMLIEEYSKND